MVQDQNLVRGPAADIDQEKAALQKENVDLKRKVAVFDQNKAMDVAKLELYADQKQKLNEKVAEIEA